MLVFCKAPSFIPVSIFPVGVTTSYKRIQSLALACTQFEFAHLQSLHAHETKRLCLLLDHDRAMAIS